jgi:hypothetical protein
MLLSCMPQRLAARRVREVLTEDRCAPTDLVRESLGSGSVVPVMPTRAPAAASRRAMAAPIPRLAPVTSTARPDRSMTMTSILIGLDLPAL